MSKFTRAPLGGAVLAALALAALPAQAHVTLEVASAPANSTFKAVFVVPHGCDGQSTNTVTIALPEGFIDVKPMPKAGWSLSTHEAPFQNSYELWGDTVSEGVTEVSWSGGNLPDDQFDEFVLRGRVTEFAPGTSLPFKVVQTCADGTVEWTEVAAPGVDPHSLAHPAPTLTVSAGDHGAGGHGSHGAAAPAGPIAVEAAWLRQPPPGADVAGGYATITNTGDEDDVLLGASVSFAGRVEVHEMSVVDGLMRMSPVAGGLPIPAGESVTLSPGGYHLMLLGLSDAPKKGDHVPITFEFEKAGAVEVMMDVGGMGANKPDAGHAGHSMSGHN